MNSNLWTKNIASAPCMLAIMGLLCAGTALSEDARKSPNENTVSVATLRTPVKARQHFEKARQAAQGGRPEEYARELAAALAIDPDFSEAYVLRASREVVEGRFAAAIEDARTARRLDRASLWALIVEASAYNGLGRYEEAVAALEGLRAADAGVWQAVYERTRAEVGRGDAAAALHWSSLVIECVPAARRDEAILLQGNAFLLAHRWHEAAAQLEAYLASPRPQPQRERVLAVLHRTQLYAAEASSAELATR